LLAIGGIDLRTQRWTARRKRLGTTGGHWAPPLQLTPVTTRRSEGIVRGAARRDGGGRARRQRRFHPLHPRPQGRLGEGTFCRGRRCPPVGLRTNGPGQALDRGGSNVNDTCRR
jgi:hypothetical protein